MKRYFLILPVLLGIYFLGIKNSYAQTIVGNYGIQYVASIPTGSCSTNSAIQVYTTSGTIYTCQSGTWGVVGSGGAPSTCTNGNNYACLNTTNTFTVAQTINNTTGVPLSIIDTDASGFITLQQSYATALGTTSKSATVMGQTNSNGNSMYQIFQYIGNNAVTNNYEFAWNGNGTNALTFFNNSNHITVNGNIDNGFIFDVQGTSRATISSTSPIFSTGTASNTDSAGTATLTSGTAALTVRTFSGTYTSAPICWVQPDGASTANLTTLGIISKTTTTTSLTIATGSNAPANITISYGCTTRN